VPGFAGACILKIIKSHNSLWGKILKIALSILLVVNSCPFSEGKENMAASHTLAPSSAFSAWTKTQGPRSVNLEDALISKLSIFLTFPEVRKFLYEGVQPIDIRQFAIRARRHMNDLLSEWLSTYRINMEQHAFSRKKVRERILKLTKSFDRFEFHFEKIRFEKDAIFLVLEIKGQKHPYWIRIYRKEFSKSGSSASVKVYGTLLGDFWVEMTSSEVPKPDNSSLKSSNVFSHKVAAVFLSFVMTFFSVSFAQARPEARFLDIRPSSLWSPTREEDLVKESKQIERDLQETEIAIRELKKTFENLRAEREELETQRARFISHPGEISGQLSLRPGLWLGLEDLLILRWGLIRGVNYDNALEIPGQGMNEHNFGLAESPFVSLRLHTRSKPHSKWQHSSSFQYTLMDGRVDIYGYHDERLMSILSASGNLARSLERDSSIGPFGFDLILGGQTALLFDHFYGSHPNAYFLLTDWTHGIPDILLGQSSLGQQWRYSDPRGLFKVRYVSNVFLDIYPKSPINFGKVDIDEIVPVFGASLLGEVSTRALKALGIPDLSLSYERQLLSKRNQERFSLSSSIDAGMREPLQLEAGLTREKYLDLAYYHLFPIPFRPEMSLYTRLWVPVGGAYGYQAYFYGTFDYERYPIAPNADGLKGVIGFNVVFGSSGIIRDKVAAESVSQVSSKPEFESFDGLIRSGVIPRGLKSLNYDKLSHGLTRLVEERLLVLGSLSELIMDGILIQNLPDLLQLIEDPKVREFVVFLFDRIRRSPVYSEGITLRELLSPEKLKLALPAFVEDLVDSLSPIVAERGRKILEDRRLSRDTVIGSFALLTQNTHALDMWKMIVEPVKLKEFLRPYTASEYTLYLLASTGEEAIVKIAREVIAEMVISFQEDARRLIRVAAAADGRTALQVNQNELRKIAEGAKNKVLRQVQLHVESLYLEKMKEAESRRSRLIDRKRALEAELFQRRLKTGGFARIGLLAFIAIFGISWYLPFAWAPVAALAVSTVSLALASQEVRRAVKNVLGGKQSKTRFSDRVSPYILRLFNENIWLRDIWLRGELNEERMDKSIAFLHEAMMKEGVREDDILEVFEEILEDAQTEIENGTLSPAEAVEREIQRRLHDEETKARYSLYYGVLDYLTAQHSWLRSHVKARLFVEDLGRFYTRLEAMGIKDRAIKMILSQALKKSQAGIESKTLSLVEVLNREVNMRTSEARTKAGKDEGENTRKHTAIDIEAVMTDVLNDCRWLRELWIRGNFNMSRLRDSVKAFISIPAYQNMSRKEINRELSVIFSKHRRQIEDGVLSPGEVIEKKIKNIGVKSNHRKKYHAQSARRGRKRYGEVTLEERIDPVNMILSHLLERNKWLRDMLIRGDINQTAFKRALELVYRVLERRGLNDQKIQEVLNSVAATLHAETVDIEPEHFYRLIAVRSMSLVSSNGIDNLPRTAASEILSQMANFPDAMDETADYYESYLVESSA